MPDRRDRRERAIERRQQTDNAWGRFDIRHDNTWVAIVIGVVAAATAAGGAPRRRLDPAELRQPRRRIRVLPLLDKV